MKTQTVQYQDGDQVLTGFLAFDDAPPGRRPGTPVVHGWWGLNDDAKGWMVPITENQEAWRRCALAGLEALKANNKGDGQRLAAIGERFGGATVMQMAYAGADLDGVVSFHAALPEATPEQQKSIKPSILIAHGEQDCHVPPGRVAAFQQALNAAGADWQRVTHGGAKQGLTTPDAGRDGMDSLADNPKADARSWALIQSFLAEVLAP